MCVYVRVSRYPKLSSPLSVQDTASSAHPVKVNLSQSKFGAKGAWFSFKILGLQFGAVVLGADLLVGGSSFGVLRIVAFSLNSLSLRNFACR